ncbi:MAG: UDP-2,4-diacetamido-2,4,6-trideoxy-beta-L-altropyranose hydrolase [Lachnospiraceae bacterium]|nr:UDP-2,4-diacetamido-2,4,6-trideoxy-beta-L-altropyranose hydrolase [Lachnospiraceae bacterium]
MIWIRADANREIGAGHVMRCLSIADALRDKGEEVLFLVADETAEKLLAERGQAYRVLHSDYRKLEQELPGLLSLLREEKPGLLLIDSYFVTKEYLRQVGELVKTAYLDDYGTLPYPVDILINYNIYGDQIDYKGMFSDSTSTAGMRLLLGSSYAPLRPEFSQATYVIKDQVEKVLVTMGGSDRYNLTGQFLRQVFQDKEACGLHYHVVSGAFNPYLSYLTEMSDRYKNIHLHQNVRNMAELMCDCDLAVTAAGSTVYELCAVGIPILCFSFAENQRRIAEAFQKKSIAGFSCDYKKEGQAMFSKLLPRLKELAENPALRQDLSRRGRELVDGHGAERLAEQLLRGEHLEQ